MDVGFYQPPTPDASGGNDAYARQLAQMMLRGQPGQMQNGVYQAPGAGSYIAQLAGGALQGGLRNRQLDANKAATALNGGVPTVGQTPDIGSRLGSWLGGLFGGGGA